MIQSDLYIRGNKEQLQVIKNMVLTLAEQIKCDTSDESFLYIPLGMVMQLLTGDSLYQGLLIGMNTNDRECVVLRFEYKDIEHVYEAFMEYFAGIDIEVDEDVADVPWPFNTIPYIGVPL